MRTILFICASMLLADWSIAAPKIYRCSGADGETLFSQSACGATAFWFRSAARDQAGGGLRDTERRWLKAREKTRKKQRSQRAKTRPSGRAAADQARKQAYRCTRKRRALDKVNHQLRSGYRAGKGDGLRRRRQAHEDYLDAFCS